MNNSVARLLNVSFRSHEISYQSDANVLLKVSHINNNNKDNSQ